MITRDTDTEIKQPSSSPEVSHFEKSILSLCVNISLASVQHLSAVDRPVDKVEEDVRSRENHSGVLVDRMRVLNDVESTQALLLLGGGGLAAHGQMDHHVFRFLWNLVQVFLFLLWHHGLLCVASQAVGVGLAVGTIQHGHGSCLGDPAGAGQRLAGKKYAIQSLILLELSQLLGTSFGDQTTCN